LSAEERNDNALVGLSCFNKCVNQKIHISGFQKRLIREINHDGACVERNCRKPGPDRTSETFMIVAIFYESYSLLADRGSHPLGFVPQDDDDLVDCGCQQRIHRVCDQWFAFERQKQLVSTQPGGHTGSGNKSGGHRGAEVRSCRSF